VIKNAVGATATCTGGTSLGLTVRKGTNKVVEEVIVMSGSTEGYWSFSLVDDATGRGLIVFSTGRGDLGTVSSVQTISTGSRLTPGVWPLTFTALHRPTTIAPGDPLLAPVIETCTAQVTVTVV
jgi:hypothetical protein